MKLILITISVLLLINVYVSAEEIHIAGRINNGEDVTNIENFNYQVGMKLFNNERHVFWCGGSVLSKKWILTAAHCLVGMKKVILYLGVINRWNPEVGSILINVTNNNFKINDDYNPVTKKDDIGLIKLIEPIQFSNRIKAINMIYNGYSAINEFDNQDAIISGWGASANDNSISNLQSATVQILPQLACQNFYNNTSATISSSKICTIAKNDVGVCKGDSGGPLVIRKNNKLYQIGIASFMLKNTCNTSNPRVFTRVFKYLDWICSKTGICQMYMPKD